MKKRVIAILLAMAMATQPMMVGAAEFTDGQGQDEIIQSLDEDVAGSFTDDVEEVVEPVEVNEPLLKLTDELSIINQKTEWIYHSSINVYYTPNKTSRSYVTWVDKGAEAPAYDSDKESYFIPSNHYKVLTLSGLPEDEVDVYICIQDEATKQQKSIIVPIDYTARPEVKTTKMQVGDNVYATVVDDTLTLSGSGGTYNYTPNDFQWGENIDKSTIKHVKFEGDIAYIGDYFFSSFTRLEEIELPSSLTSLGTDVFVFCIMLKKIVFPASLKEIPRLSIETSLSGLSEVIIPEGVEIIGNGAFYGCSSLPKITLPSTITQIGQEAFAWTSISDFKWPETTTIISKGIFYGCSNLNEFLVPETVTGISDNAFSDCTSLTKITIPVSVTYIGNDAFYNDRNLTIYGYRDSMAEKYADNNNIPFVSADYKVVFKDNGRTQKTEYVLSGENATSPVLTKEGYTLSWDADYTNIREDMIVNAVWTKDVVITPSPTPGPTSTPQPPIIVVPSETTKHTVTFVDRGKIVKTEKVESGKAADYPYIQRNGYELTWDTDFSNITSDITVNAVWTVINPSKVTGLTAEVLAKSIRLSWDESKYASRYLVYRKTATDEEYQQLTKTTKELYTDNTVEFGTEYQYKVVAIRSVAGEKYESEASDIVTAKLDVPQTGDIYTVGNLNYKIMNDSEVRVSGMAKTVSSISIPAVVTINGKSFNVTGIDHRAFYRNESLVSARIGNNVNYVGQYSFYQCPSLESVKFGRRVKIISTCAFTQCPNLGNIVLPASVERLGAKVFYHCPNIKILTIKAKNLNYIGTKGLAIDRSTVIRVPSTKFKEYKKLIRNSVTFRKTKIKKM